jgi:hypothetical protein
MNAYSGVTAGAVELHGVVRHLKDRLANQFGVDADLW